jgi:cell division protein FtsB
MRTLIEKGSLIKRNLPVIIAFLLCCYFSYHVIFGQRSYLELTTLNQQIASLSLQNQELQTQRIALETRVTKLRPGSIDPDLLEERARYVLGYARPDEKVIVGQN